MPNGKGQIDCGYCLHWACSEEEWGYGSGAYDGVCNCWDVAIPRTLTKQHRFCLDFMPSKYFGEDNGVGHPEEPDKRSTDEIARDRLTEYMQLKPGMEIGVLYHYQDHAPDTIAPLMRLDAAPEPRDNNSS